MARTVPSAVQRKTHRMTWAGGNPLIAWNILRSPHSPFKDLGRLYPIICVPLSQTGSQTSCGWMMWNWQLSALACGANIVLYDGRLSGPETLWKVVAEQGVTVFGTNPSYIHFTEAAAYSPNVLDLTALRAVLSTGSILYPQQFDWIVEHVKRVPVQSISGGTDILGCFVLGNPLLPVYRGQAQCRSLGLDVRSLPPTAKIGELICANPFPSRPIGFYGETSNERYHDAYFA